MNGKSRLPLVLLGAALLVFFVSSAGMSRKIEPFHSWYFCFAWWSYIAALESVLAWRGGYSLLFDRPGRFLRLLPLSVTVWLVFEAFNLRLENWAYLNLPASAPLRWAGYLLSYATVLPALSATHRLLEFMGLFEGHSVKPLWNSPRLHKRCIVAGCLMLALPLALPQFCFPLVWAGFVFLLEPFVRRAGGVSLLADWEEGSLRQLLLLLVTGAVCGLLWEIWNFRAGAKWFYTLPFAGEMKLFEMPLLGYLGFPAFAVECYVLTNAFDALADRLGRLSPAAKTAAWVGLCLAAAAFDIAVIAGIDAFSVASFRP